MFGPDAAFSPYQCEIVNSRDLKRHIRLDRISQLSTDYKEMR